MEMTLGELKKFIEQALSQCTEDTKVYLGAYDMTKVFTVCDAVIDEDYDVVLYCNPFGVDQEEEND